MAGTPDQAWAKNGEKNHESVKGGAEKQGAVLLRTETAMDGADMEMGLRVSSSSNESSSRHLLSTSYERRFP